MIIRIYLDDSEYEVHDSEMVEIDGFDKEEVKDMLEKANSIMQKVYDLDCYDDEDLGITLSSEQKNEIKYMRDNGYTIDTMLNIAEYLFDVEFNWVSADLIFEMEA